jgi:hypothetical protein
MQHLLVGVVARQQHHAVFAEGDRLMVVIGGHMSDVQNRHCGATIPYQAVSSIKVIWAVEGHAFLGPKALRGRQGLTLLPSPRSLAAA